MKEKAALLAITHYDDTRTQTGLLDYHLYCLEHGFDLPVSRLDAREKDQVKQTVLRLLEIIKSK